MVAFQSVPANIRVPLFYAEIDGSQASSAAAGTQPTLLVGQRLSTGTVAAGVLTLISSAGQANSAFGRGSILARMCAIYLRNDRSAELWAIGVDDNGAGVKATGTLAITGPAAADGTISLYIGGQLVEVAVADTDTATAIGDAIVAAIVAAPDLPVTSANVDGTVTLTALHKGLLGNDIDLRLNYLGPEGGQALPEDVAIVITPMSGGTTDPALTGVVTAIGDELFDFIGAAYTNTTPLDTLHEEVTDRWEPLRQIYGHLFGARRGTTSQLGTYGDGRNGPHETVLGIEGVPNPPWEVAAAVCGQAAKSLRNDPARPLQTLPLIGILVPQPSDRWTVTERNVLLHSGISTAYVSGGYLRLDRAITTYQTNAFSLPDDSYLDVETLYTLTYVVRRLRNRLTTKYPRHKLVNDGTRFAAGVAAVTPSVIRGELIAEYAQMERLAIVENAAAFSENLIVERNADNPNRVDILFPPDLANQLRIIGTLVQFRLQYPAEVS